MINLQINLQNRDRAGFSLALTALPLQVKEEPHSFRVAFLTYRKHCTNPCLTKCTEMGGTGRKTGGCSPMCTHLSPWHELAMLHTAGATQTPVTSPHSCSCSEDVRTCECMKVWSSGAGHHFCDKYRSTTAFFFCSFLFFSPSQMHN